MTGARVIISLIAMTILVFVSGTEYKLAANYPREAPKQRTQSDDSFLDTSFGFPVRISYSSALVLGQRYSDRVMFLLIEERYCSADVFRKVFEGLAERYREAEFIRIDVYSDPEMLRRAIGRHKGDPTDELTFPDTPEGVEFEKAVRGDLFIPKTGWARARYFKEPREGERFFYKRDPERVEMVEVVIKPKLVPNYTGDLQADLFLASQLGDLAKAKDLINKGAKIEYKNESGETALVSAVGHNKLDIVTLLLAHGAGVDEKNRYGQTGLNKALSHGFYDVFRVLLEHQADVNARYGSGISPLHVAVDKGNVDAVEALLSKGSDPNAVDGEGNTPLFDAIRTRKNRIVNALLQSGARVNVNNNRGDTPLDLANKIGDQSIIDALRNTERPAKSH